MDYILPEDKVTYRPMAKLEIGRSRSQRADRRLEYAVKTSFDSKYMNTNQNEPIG